jgi:hypothetical protein
VGKFLMHPFWLWERQQHGLMLSLLPSKKHDDRGAITALYNQTMSTTRHLLLSMFSIWQHILERCSIGTLKNMQLYTKSSMGF